MPAYVNAGMAGALMSYEHAAKRKRLILTVLHRSTEKPASRAEVPSVARMSAVRFSSLECA
jgi:hypothetical protein